MKSILQHQHHLCSHLPLIKKITIRNFTQFRLVYKVTGSLLLALFLILVFQTKIYRGNQEAAAASTNSDRLIIIAIDSLSPEYLSLNSTASGPGKPGNWLMPNVHSFVEDSTYWPHTEGHFPHTTDSNHLNILAGTNSGLNSFSQ